MRAALSNQMQGFSGPAGGRRSVEGDSVKRTFAERESGFCSGNRGGRPRAACLAVLGLVVLLGGGCATVYPPPRPVQAASPEDFLERSKRLAQLEGERNAVLNYMRLGTVALGMGQYEESARAFDEAVRRILTIYANTPDAAKARKIWYQESVKAFRGEPYERAMALFFRGLLYYREGDYDNARACFRSAEFQDAIAEEDQNRCDFVVMDWLEALCDVRLGQADMAADALKHAREVRPDLPDIDPNSNVLVVLLTGAAPVKTLAGRHGERLVLSAQPNPVRGVSVWVDGAPFGGGWMRDSVSYQATTRGGRGVDFIQDRKARYKTAGQTVATVGEAAGTGLLAYGVGKKNRDLEAAGAGVLAAGLLADIAASRIQAQADIRAWDTLPDAILVAVGRVTPGSHVMEVSYTDAEGRTLFDEPQQLRFEVPADGNKNAEVIGWSNPPQFRYVPLRAER